MGRRQWAYRVRMERKDGSVYEGKFTRYDGAERKAARLLEENAGSGRFLTIEDRYAGTRIWRIA